MAEKASGVGAEQREKGKRKEINEQKMIKIQNVILNHMPQLAKLCMAIGTKGSLAQRDTT